MDVDGYFPHLRRRDAGGERAARRAGRELQGLRVFRKLRSLGLADRSPQVQVQARRAGRSGSDCTLGLAFKPDPDGADGLPPGSLTVTMGQAVTHSAMPRRSQRRSARPSSISAAAGQLGLLFAQGFEWLVQPEEFTPIIEKRRSCRGFTMKLPVWWSDFRHNRLPADRLIAGTKPRLPAATLC